MLAGIVVSICCRFFIISAPVKIKARNTFLISAFAGMAAKGVFSKPL